MVETASGAETNAEGGASWALFLDFDGTLVDIAEHPDAVVVEPGLVAALARLREHLGGALALISGRPIETLDRFLAPERFDAAGLHGLERRSAGELFACVPEDYPNLRRGVARLQDRLAGREGVVIEDKGCSVAVHWRMAPDEADEAKALVREVATTLGPDYRVQHGKAVAEILPASAGKGPVIERLLQSPPFQGRRPIFVGDDLTDENGFLAVNARGGVSIRIGEGPTAAAHRVETPAAFRAWLARWAEGGQITLPP